MIVAEFHRERSPVAATLLVAILLLFFVGTSSIASVRKDGPMSVSEMSVASGKGMASLLETVGILGGAVALGLAVTCVVAPFAAPFIISSTFGALGTWMAGSGTLALGVGLLGLSGAASIAGGVAAIATDR